MGTGGGQLAPTASVVGNRRKIQGAPVGLNRSEKSPSMTATTALLKDHLVETFTSGLHRSVASLKSIDLEYVGNNIGVGAGW